MREFYDDSDLISSDMQIANNQMAFMKLYFFVMSLVSVVSCPYSVVCTAVAGDKGGKCSISLQLPDALCIQLLLHSIHDSSKSSYIVSTDYDTKCRSSQQDSDSNTSYTYPPPLPTPTPGRE